MTFEEWVEKNMRKIDKDTSTMEEVIQLCQDCWKVAYDVGFDEGCASMEDEEPETATDLSEYEQISKDLDLPIYSQDTYKEFVVNAYGAGLDLEHYHGRFFFKGPSVNCERDSLDETIRLLKVPVQWDNLGLGWIVYPK